MALLRNGLVALIGAALASASSSSQETAASRPIQWAGTRGINVHGWMTWTPQTSPTTYKLPVFSSQKAAMTDQEIATLHRAGLNFIRLTTDPVVFMQLSGADRNQATASLLSAIDQIRRQGLSVLVDMHPVKVMHPFGIENGGGDTPLEMGPDHPFTQRYAAAIAWLAGVLDKHYARDGQVAFELLNEPDLACSDTKWPAEERQLHQAVRTAAPHLTLVLTGACWDDAQGLLTLDPRDFADGNTLYTFHFYDDHMFTHQGSHLTGTPDQLAYAFTGGLPYPWNARADQDVMAEIANRAAGAPPEVKAAALAMARRYLDRKWDRNRIDARMNLVANWARTNGIAPNRILMGEFGVSGRRGAIVGARDEDRLRWLTDARTSAENYGFRWALWQYRGNDFGDAFELASGPGLIDPAMARAVGLSVPADVSH